MDIRKLLIVPALAGALALGGCGGEEEGAIEEGVGVVEEGVGEGVGAVEEGVGEGVGAVGAGADAAVGGTEILGNGIDDDGDGLIDEEV